MDGVWQLDDVLQNALGQPCAVAGYPGQCDPAPERLFAIDVADRLPAAQLSPAGSGTGTSKPFRVTETMQ